LKGFLEIKAAIDLINFLLEVARSVRELLKESFKQVLTG